MFIIFLRSYKGLRIKSFMKTKLKTQLISTPYLYIFIFIKFVSVPSKPAFENNHIILFLVEGKGFFKKSIVCGSKCFWGNRGVGTEGTKGASTPPIFWRKDPSQPWICLFSCPISVIHSPNFSIMLPLGKSGSWEGQYYKKTLGTVHILRNQWG